MSPTTAYLLYLVFALGGAGLYFQLPHGERARPVVGALFGVAAVVALVIVLAVRVVTGEANTAYFLLFSALAVVAAARVITHRKPVYSAIYFVLVVVAVAALLILQQAEFLAVALVIIYAGAILVTYLFVIMLAQQPVAPIYDLRAREPFLAVLAGFVLMAAIAGRAGDLPVKTPPRAGVVPSIEATTGVTPAAERALPAGNTLALGAALMTRYVVVLEVSGVLLLISMIGAIALSRKRVPTEGYHAPPAPIGQVGKEVLPY